MMTNMEMGQNRMYIYKEGDDSGGGGDVVVVLLKNV